MNVEKQFKLNTFYEKIEFLRRNSKKAKKKKKEKSYTISLLNGRKQNICGIFSDCLGL